MTPAATVKIRTDAAGGPDSLISLFAQKLIAGLPDLNFDNGYIRGRDANSILNREDELVVFRAVRNKELHNDRQVDAILPLLIWGIHYDGAKCRGAELARRM